MTHPAHPRYQGTNAVLHIEGFDPIPVTVKNWPPFLVQDLTIECELPPMPEGELTSLKRLGDRLPWDEQPPVPPPSIGPRGRWGGVK